MIKATEQFFVDIHNISLQSSLLTIITDCIKLKEQILFFKSELSPHALYINKKKLLKCENILTVTSQIFCFVGCSNLQRKRC